MKTDRMPIVDSVRCDMTSVQFIRTSAIFRNKEVSGYYQSIFDQCDTNKDGKITVQELNDFLTNHRGDDIPASVIQALYVAFDKDHNQLLDFNEFLELINHPAVARTFSRVGRYLEHVVRSSVSRKSLRLRRTVTNTGEYEDQAEINKYAVGMLIVSLVQTIIYYATPKDMKKQFYQVIENLVFDPCHREKLWTYFTYIFVHSGMTHLYGNIVFQMVYGFPLELVHSWRVVPIYVIGGFGGCLLHAVLEDCNSLYGGSGGVSALCCAQIGTIIMNWKEMSHPLVYLIIFGMVAVFDIIWKFVVMFTSDHKSTVSVSAHFGGAIVGLLLGVNLLKNLRQTKGEKTIWLISMIVLAVSMAACISQIVHMGPYDEKKCKYNCTAACT